MKTCIFCGKKIEDESQIINEYDVCFCSKRCLERYQDKLNELKEVVDLDDCC